MSSSLMLWNGLGLSASLTTAYYVKNRSAQARSWLRTPASALLALFSRHATCPHALVSLSPASTAWRAGDDAGVSFIEGGKFWLAAGDPIAAADARVETAQQFAAAATANHRLPVFLPSTEEFAQQMRAAGWSCLKLGASPYFDLETWNPRGNVARQGRQRRRNR